LSAGEGDRRRAVYVADVEEPLPPGERVLWQGRPERRLLARHAFHVRKIAVYFAILFCVRAGFAIAGPNPAEEVLAAIPLFAAMCLAVIGIAQALAWLSSRTTVYAITDRRIVMRVGIVLPATLNLPLRLVESAELKRFADGSGDIALTVGGEDKLSYVHLWPHARAWRLGNAQPSLRGLGDVAAVGAVLRDAAGALVEPGAEPAVRTVAAPAAATVRPAMASAASDR